MNKKIILTVLLVSLSLTLNACSKKQVQNQEDKQEVAEPEIIVNDYYEVDDGMKIVLRDTNLAKNDKPDTVIEDGIDFSDLTGVTYEHIGSIEKNNITDAWLIKLGDGKQYNEVVKRIREYLQNLKQKYKDNAEITSILSSEDNIKISQKEGIVMAVFAPDAGAIIGGMEDSLSLVKYKDNSTEDDIGENIMN